MCFPRFVFENVCFPTCLHTFEATCFIGFWKDRFSHSSRKLRGDRLVARGAGRERGQREREREGEEERDRELRENARKIKGTKIQ